MSRKLTVGELIALHAPDRIDFGELLPHLEILFVENRDTEQPSEPIQARDWEEAVSLVRTRYPQAFFEPWEVFDNGSFDCAGTDREGEIEISTRFYESERASVSDALNPSRLEDCGVGGWIVWYCKLLDTTKER